MVREKMYNRGDVVRVTENVAKLVETQWLPEEYAKDIAGKEFVVECSFKDKSYDLEGTLAKLDNSVLEYVGHPPRAR